MSERTSSIAGSLAAIVGENYVSEEDFVRHSYTRTPSWITGVPPAVVVRPANAQEISEIVKLANKEKIPVIPRGGGASVAGFPLSERAEQSILVDITRLNKLLYIDEQNLTVGAECGIILSELSTQLAQKGYHMHTVDMPQYIDTLGGALSGFNGGGEPSDLATVGEMGQFLLGMEVVLPNGEIVTTGAGPGTNIHATRMVDRYPGSPFMSGIFIADGGIFGIKTKAHFYITPKPTNMVYGGYHCDDLDQVHDILVKLMRTVPYPYTRVVSLTAQGQDKWSLFYGIRGCEEEISFKEKIFKQICEDGGAVPAPADIALETLMRFSGRQLGKWYASRGRFLYFEYVFGRSEGKDYLKNQGESVREQFSKLGLLDCITDQITYLIPKERHSFILGQVYFLNENMLTAKDMVNVRNLTDSEAKNVLRQGGFMEGNQGSLAMISGEAWSEPYREFMKTIKTALDPNNIMNPGLWRL